MAGLVPAIHAETLRSDADAATSLGDFSIVPRHHGVDARDERGHDGSGFKTAGTTAKASAFRPARKKMKFSDSEAEAASSDWIENLPSLKQLDEATKASLRESAIRKTLPRGSVLFRPGDACIQFPLIAEGTVRIQRLTESGREIVLYRIAADETCILTTASLISGEVYAAEGVAETDVVAHILTADRFRALMDRSAAFRALVFLGYSRRIATLMSRIEELVCTRINVRLAERLLSLGDAGNHVASTQQALAADLGTAREVIGRTLKAFERSGWVRLSRGGAEITDRQALVALCESQRRQVAGPV